MVKRFRVKYIYITSDDSITELDIRKAINPKVTVFDNVESVSVDEI